MATSPKPATRKKRKTPRKPRPITNPRLVLTAGQVEIALHNHARHIVKGFYDLKVVGTHRDGSVTIELVDFKEEPEPLPAYPQHSAFQGTDKAERTTESVQFYDNTDGALDEEEPQADRLRTVLQ